MELTCKPIRQRYSCRLFDTTKEIPQVMMDGLIYAASLAPSGKNMQPWKFRIVNGSEFGRYLCELLPRNKWLKDCSRFICVFLDTAISNHPMKDYMSVGAAIENILIEAEGSGLSTCWVGECTEYNRDICGFLGVDPVYRLLAIVVVGYAKRKMPPTAKKEPKDIIL